MVRDFAHSIQHNVATSNRLFNVVGISTVEPKMFNLAEIPNVWSMPSYGLWKYELLSQVSEKPYDQYCPRVLQNNDRHFW
jgi:hypothetical protein